MRGVLVAVLGVWTVARYSSSAGNNVCPTFEDYYTVKNNTKCWYDLAADYTAPEIIELLGYPVLTYKIPTRDGHILTVFRIPRDPLSPKNPYAKYHPVYLQHGLVSTCANFVGLGKDSLAIVLADAGYDVWLGNYRGTQYSEEHVNLSVTDQQFWDHSMDEVATIDLPATFHTIVGNIGPESKIIYIGHSLGTTFALMYGSQFPEEARSIVKMFVLLCPAYTLSNMISPYRSAAPFGNLILDTVWKLKMQRVVSQAEELGRLTKPLCTESPELMRFCMQLYNLFYGPNADFGPEIVPVYFNQLPGGTSIKILNHAADMVLGNFRHYNYFERNFEVYGTKDPPIYDISRMTVPVYIVYSSQDWATPEADAWNLYRHLPQTMRYGIRKIDMDNFNHIDFIFGRNAKRVVYEPLVELLNRAIIN